MGIEIYQLSRYYRYFGTIKLWLLLELSKYKINMFIFDWFTKYYFFGQNRNKSQGYFKFILQNNINFKYTIFVDSIYMTIVQLCIYIE